PVAAAIDAVGPRQQQLAGPPGGKLVGLVPGDQRLAAMSQLTQPRAQFGDAGEVLARGDLVLRSGEQAHGRTVAAGVMADIVPAAAGFRPGMPQCRRGCLGSGGTVSPADNCTIAV